MDSREGQAVADSDKKKVDAFQYFDKRRRTIVWIAITLYLLINNSINATSVWMEHTRDGEPQIAVWEPFIWEYSSAISSLVVLPIMFYWFSRYVFVWRDWRRQLFTHLGVATVFSLAHVALMVSLREGAYIFAGGNYDFGDVPREFFYEWRKDIWGYIFWFAVYHGYQFIYRRLKGEASLVEQYSQEALPEETPEHVLVKKLDKEYIVKLQEVEWLESAGNYVNLHSNGRSYPLRGTMKSFIDRTASQGFKRIHRSYGVNINKIAHIQYQPSGDGEITLTNKTSLPLSRRYKDHFKKDLQA